MRRRRNSLRLTGFDYSQEGVYFVTMLIHARRRVLGTIVDGRMKLSETGRVIDKIWAQLPIQFGNIRTGRIQIMPDHLHGIIEIRTVSHESRTGAGARKSIGMLNPLQKSDTPPRVQFGFD